MLTNYTVVVGVTGGIAAYKACTLVSMLVSAHAHVHVVMTHNATEFVSPLTFETLSGNPVVTDTFTREQKWEVEHVTLAQKADLFVIAPATANFIGKYALGVADDFLTTTAMAMKCPVVVCPAMNTRMLTSATVIENLETLRRRGVAMLYGRRGRLACGESGDGRMAEPQEIFDCIRTTILPKSDLLGRKVLITAGGTREDVDGVRCITNYSSGKMGAAIADAATKRGAIVTYIEGSALVHPSTQVVVLPVTSTQDLFDVTLAHVADQDFIIMAAAPADYRVESKLDNKIHGERVTLELVKNPDVAAAVGRVKTKAQKLVIFCAETEDLLARAKEKRIKKGADLVVANDVSRIGGAFGADTNQVTIIGEGVFDELDRMAKSAVADIILDRLHDC